MKNIYIVIPCYDPDEKIMDKFLSELKKEFTNILIINDGSSEIHDKYFKKLAKSGLEIINNYRNYGKGRALKYAFNYLLNKYPKLEGVVTCDCDGQHTVSDIVKVTKELSENKNKLILGVRSFNDRSVPFRSRFGNHLTRGVFKMFIGLDITDTQTGLRGISKDLMIKFLDTPGERYEYETNMLIKAKNDGIKIKEIVIETVYIEDNKTSHFNPVKDSIKIYRLFLKYFLSSLTSFVIDVALFGIFLVVFTNFDIISRIIIATMFARIISSLWNYFINANLVFKDMSVRTIIMYYVLVLVQMFISSFVVIELYMETKISLVILKIIVDALLFIINYIMQKEVIFKRIDNEEE